MIAAVLLTAVDSQDNALGAETPRKARNELGILERRRVDGDLVCALVEHFLRVRDAANSAGNAERDIDLFRDAADPGAVNGAPVRTRGDVVKHELVGALVAITLSKLDDLPDDTMIAELDALDDDAVAHVEARNYALCRNEFTSATVILPSSSALPVMAAGTPMSLSVSMSAIWRTPPDACRRTSG